jgi:hypothetical protein
VSPIGSGPARTPAQSPSPRRTDRPGVVIRSKGGFSQARVERFFVYLQMLEHVRPSPATISDRDREPADAPSREARARPGRRRERAEGDSTNSGSARATDRAARAAAVALVMARRKRPSGIGRGWPQPLRRGGPRRRRSAGRRGDATARARLSRSRHPGRRANRQLYESTRSPPRSEHRPSSEISERVRSFADGAPAARPRRGRALGYSAASRLRPCSSCAACSRAGEGTTAAKRLQANRTPATTK